MAILSLFPKHHFTDIEFRLTLVIPDGESSRRWHHRAVEIEGMPLDGDLIGAPLMGPF
jgi:hypothetical protein